MKTRAIQKLLFIPIVFLIAGCASAPVVQPTYQEMNAARKYKKTAAVIEVTDSGSNIKGINATVRTKLENILVRHFNLVERTKIRDIFKERNFSSEDNVKRYTQIGDMLGADFLIFGNAAASLNSPEIKYRQHAYDSGKFRGRIWEEVSAEASVGIKIIDVKNGLIIYSDTKQGNEKERINRQRYKDKDLFNKTLRTKSVSTEFIKIADRFSRLQKNQVSIVSDALDESINKLAIDVKSFIPQIGEILRFVSNDEVVVNLGSAYGIKPGDILIVWQEGRSLTDPKTGMVITPKQKKAYLKVIKVTSGLSSVAKIKGSVTGRLMIGDKVHTQR